MRPTTIHINNLAVSAIIGTNDGERETAQKLLIDIRFMYDAKQAAATDDLNKAVDYCTLKDDIIRQVSQTRFYLLEKLADFLLDIILTHSLITEATVKIKKPQALPEAEAVALEMTKRKKIEA